MQYDVGGCVICISYEVEYLDKERSYKNSTKEVILLFYLIFPIQLTKCWTKFRFINTLINQSVHSLSSLFCNICRDIAVHGYDDTTDSHSSVVN